MSEPITVFTVVRVPPRAAWDLWTRPEHVRGWNFASDDWACPEASNDLRPGGRFAYTMAARDGSASFVFGGTHDAVEPAARLASTLGDGRRVEVRFEPEGDAATRVTETFDPEGTFPLEAQRAGWAAILENFRAYAERTPPDPA